MAFGLNINVYGETINFVYGCAMKEYYWLHKDLLVLLNGPIFLPCLTTTQSIISASVTQNSCQYQCRSYHAVLVKSFLWLPPSNPFQIWNNRERLLITVLFFVFFVKDVCFLQQVMAQCILHYMTHWFQRICRASGRCDNQLKHIISLLHNMSLNFKIILLFSCEKQT